MLTKEIANVIVRETSLRLNRNVNIMDIRGEIIATRDESRLHTVHEGAVEVLKSGETLTIYPDQGKHGKVQNLELISPSSFMRISLESSGLPATPMIWKISGSW